MNPENAEGAELAEKLEKMRFRLKEMATEFQKRDRWVIVTNYDSVAGDAELVVEWPEGAKRQSFDALYESLKGRFGTFCRADGKEMVIPHGVRVFAVGQDGKIHLTPLQALVRNKTAKRIVSLTTRVGTVKVTADHSIMGFENEKIVPQKPETIQWVCTPQEYPAFQETISIDLEKENLFSSKVRNKNGTFLLYRNPIVKDAVLDETLMTFFGLWIADGCYHNTKGGRGIHTSAYDDAECAEIIDSVVKRFGSKGVSITDDGVTATVQSTTLYNLMHYLGISGNSHTKRAPAFVFGLNPELIGAFLRGYFSGDGTVSQGDINSTTYSEGLCKDLQTLLLFFGIKSCVRKEKSSGYNQKKEITGYKLSINYSSHKKVFTEKIGFLQSRKTEKIRYSSINKSTSFVPLKKETMSALRACAKKKQFRDELLRKQSTGKITKPMLQRILNDATQNEVVQEKAKILSIELEFEPVKNIQTVSEGVETTVYDIETEEGNFIANNIVLKNTDGLTAGGILATVMQRERKSYQTVVLKQLYPEHVPEIREKGKNFFFSDFGSGQLDFLKKEFGKNFFVLDHHQPLPIPHELHANPLEFGIDGGKEISASGMAFLFALEVDEKNKDLAALAIVGALGDMQDEHGKLIGANTLIAGIGIKEGVLEKKTDLRLYGRVSRPLTQFLAFASSPVLPGFTANEGNCVRFLQDIGIDLKEGETWVSYEMLSDAKKKELVSALILHLHEQMVPEWKIGQLIGEVYSLPREHRQSPLYDAKEFATVLNACVVPSSEVYLNGAPTEIEKITAGTIFSVQNNKIVKDRILEKTRVSVPNKMPIIKITTRAGRTVKLTPNHEVLSIFFGEPGWVSAEKLGFGDYIAISKSLPDCSKKLQFEDFIEQRELVSIGSKVRLHSAVKPICKPTFNKELGFLIGYIAGDGHVTRYSIDIAFSRKPRGIFSFKQIKRVFSQQFGCQQPTISNKKTFFNAAWHSRTLSEFVQRLGIKEGNKTKTVCFEKKLLEADKEFAAGLLRGLFSSDGNIYSGGIEFSSHSSAIVRQMVFLLQRFGIVAHTTHRKCRDCNGEKHRLLVCGSSNIKTFVKEIGFLKKDTNTQLLSLAGNMSKIHSHKEFLPVKEKLVMLGKLLGIPTKWSSHFTCYKKGKQPSIENLEKFIKFYARRLIKCELALESQNISAILKSFNASITKFSRAGGISREWVSKILTGKVPGKNAQKKIKDAQTKYALVLAEAKKVVASLESFVESDLYWDKIKKIQYFTKNLPSVVYDIRVEKNHNYIADGIVVHNCGRHSMSDIGLAVCLGNRSDAYGEALSLLAQHRRQLREGIQFVQERGIEEKKLFYFFDAENAIEDSIVGIVAGMLYGSGTIGFEKPIIALSRYPDENIKVSGRATTELVRNGINLGKAFHEICAGFGGENAGGGHKIAAGCKIEQKNRERFLELLEQKLEEQLHEKTIRDS